MNNGSDLNSLHVCQKRPSVIEALMNGFKIAYAYIYGS